MWLAIGIVIGIALLAVLLWMRNRNISLKWYEWLIMVIGLLLLAFTIQNFIGSFIEDEQVAAWYFLVVTGVPGIILIALAWGLHVRRQRVSS